MTDSNQPISIRARWDHDELPAGIPDQRGLLLEIETAKPGSTEEKQRPPLNLALVIDRSGSMHHGRLAAAKEAAIGIVNRLNKHDHLSIVIYDDEVRVLVDGRRQSKKARRETCERIRAIHTGGCTNLAGGWLRGAQCVADVMEREAIKSGHVILLSDGLANRGETDPEALTRLAGDLAERGVTSTCVGIGDNYSPLQLNAIAEAGEGEMHHSNDPDEIIEVLMGELGEATQLVARNFSITLKLPRAVTARQLTRYRRTPVDDSHEYYLGNLVGGQQRRLAFLIELPVFADPTVLKFSCTANWLDAETAMQEHSLETTFEFRVVPGQAFDMEARDKEIAHTIAELWMARHGYDAMMLNEQGLFGAAAEVFDVDAVRFSRMVDGLDDAKFLLAQSSDVRQSTTAEWRGKSKLEALALSKKALRSKPDFRRERRQSNWTDFKPEK